MQGGTVGRDAPPLRTRTAEEEADARWATRQRAVENLAHKQQQCRLIEEQGRLCVSRTGPRDPACTDLFKMQLACYGYAPPPSVQINNK